MFTNNFRHDFPNFAALASLRLRLRICFAGDIPSFGCGFAALGSRRGPEMLDNRRADEG